MQVSGYAEMIKEKIVALYGETPHYCDEAFLSLIRTLSTAEFLYKKYVSTSDDEFASDTLMDYSCIALEYYTSLELIANLLLFRLYRDKVLKPRYDQCKKTKNSSEYMKGYIGNAILGKLVLRGDVRKSLELGPLYYLYKDALIGEERAAPEYEHIEKYIESFSLKMNDAAKIGKMIFEITDLRNESAHGGKLLDISLAKKAQDVTYIHNPLMDVLCQIERADQCHQLVVNLLRWFATGELL